MFLLNNLLNIYDLFINIKHNTQPTVKGKGSAIFLHLTDKNYKPTKPTPRKYKEFQ